MGEEGQSSSTMELIVKIIYVLFICIIFAMLSLFMVRFVSSGNFYNLILKFTPTIIKTSIDCLFPVTEFQSAYNIIKQFVNQNVLNHQIYQLLFVTFHIQFGMGFLGIGFLRSEQSRRNQLIRIVGNDDSDDNEQED